MKPKKELLRIVKSPEGAIGFDRIGKAPGRGAYICKSAICLERAVKQRQLERTFEQKIDQTIYEQLMGEVEQDD